MFIFCLNLVRQAQQGGQIGMSLVGQYSEPYSNTSLDRAAAKRSMDFELGWLVKSLYDEQFLK